MISHHHRTLFVHIPKCGGQSIETAFLEALGLTWQSRAPLLLRPRVEGEAAPPRLAHLLATDYVEKCYLSPEIFETYFKFTVVRDPYDRIISFYNYLKIFEKRELNAFIQKDLPALLRPQHGMHWFFRPQVDYFTDRQGARCVDAVHRLECLEQDWPEIARRARLSNAKLPHMNKSKSIAARVEALTPVSRLIVRELYAKDFEIFPDYDKAVNES
jgi:hypothetical protein